VEKSEEGEVRREKGEVRSYKKNPGQKNSSLLTPTF
jgi:hypothetical protein